METDKLMFKIIHREFCLHFLFKLFDLTTNTHRRFLLAHDNEIDEPKPIKKTAVSSHTCSKMDKQISTWEEKCSYQGRIILETFFLDFDVLFCLLMKGTSRITRPKKDVNELRKSSSALQYLGSSR